MNNAAQHSSFYSITEVSEKLGISQKTVRRYVASNVLPSIIMAGVYRIPQESLDNFLRNSNVVQAKAIKDGPRNRNNNNMKGSRALHFNNTGKGTVHWTEVSGIWGTNKKSDLTFVDLFSGAGGITKGFEMAGLRGVCGLDWFPAAGKTYRRNFAHPFVEGDIKLQETKLAFYETVTRELRKEPLSIAAGGFPCQGFSMAGNRIIDDPRNALYKELLEIVTHLQPEFVVCENVTGLRSMLGGKVEAMILGDFRAAGYTMNVTTLRAAGYGVPQKRDRVIFIGNRIDKLNLHPQPFLMEAQYISTGQAIGDLISMEPNPEFNHVPTRHRPDMAERMLLLEEGKSLYKGYSDAWKKCPWNEASCTIKENHGGVNIHPKLPRVLTAREMARLQSFPDDFIFEGPKNKQLVQLGNAVPPLLAKAIGLAIRRSYGEL